MLLKLLIDFGLVVLIWMTQIVVYPSFIYYSEANLIHWHTKYTTAVSMIVMPLMLTQIGIHSWQLLDQFSWLGLIALFLIALAWVNTFFFAVPLHNQISTNQHVMEAAQSLVKVNWYRTLLWTLVFVLGLLEHLKK